MASDAEKLGSTFAEDGTWTLPSMTEPARGRSEIVAAFAKATHYLSFMSMLSVPNEITIDGATARGKAYCQEIIITKTQEQKVVVGCYSDSYVKRDGRWYFQTRSYQVIGKH